MSVETLIEEVNKQVKDFSITDDKIFHIIELYDVYDPPKDGKDDEPYGVKAIVASEIKANEHHEQYWDIVTFLSTLTERELQELMNLMDLGRNMTYFGFTPDVVQTFIDHVDNNHFQNVKGLHAIQYLAGKVPLGRWLRLVMQQIKAQPDTFYKIIADLWEDDLQEIKDFESLSTAWAAYRELMIPEKYRSILLVGYSLTGRAETPIAYTEIKA